jgi:hypothetical protein
VTTGGNSQNPDQCSCTPPGWTWNLTEKTCSCLDVDAIYNKSSASPVC